VWHYLLDSASVGTLKYVLQIPYLGQTITFYIERVILSLSLTILTITAILGGRMKNLIVAGITMAALSATAAQADDYFVAAAEAKGELSILVNGSSIKPTAPQTYTAWSTYVFNGSWKKEGIHVIRLMQRYDCVNETSQTLATFSYNDNAQVLSSDESYETPSHVIPESRENIALKIVCAGDERITLFRSIYYKNIDPVTTAHLVYAQLNPKSK